METWQPPRQPFWQKITQNWMFQLAVLFIIVLLVVLRDNFKTANPETQDLPSTPPPIAQMNRAAPQNEAIPQKAESFVDNSSNESSNAIQASSTAPEPTPPPAQPSASVRTQDVRFEVKVINRRYLERMMEESTRVENGVGLMSKSKYDQRMQEAPNLVRSMGFKAETFRLGQTRTLFVGEQDPNSGLQMGFFITFNPIEKRDDDKLLIGIRKWYQLKLNEELSELETFEAVIPNSAVLLIAEPSLSDVNFSVEERSLFESSLRLSLLNAPIVMDGLSDVVLVLEVNSL